MIQVLTKIGENLSLFVAIGTIVIVVTAFRFQWTCGLCGKINTTGLFRFLFLMCDHEGDGL